jgi:hypothetical protein
MRPVDVGEPKAAAKLVEAGAIRLRDAAQMVVEVPQRGHLILARSGHSRGARE